MQFLDISNAERKAVFLEVSSEKGIRPDMVEKDFWVTWTLNRLFQDKSIANVLLFKGGTSLSKAFNAIQRFSEDIDLLLDLKEVSDPSETFAKERTRNAINVFKSKIDKKTSEYITTKLLPKIKDLIAPVCSAETDLNDPKNLYIKYPAVFESGNYIRPNIKLEIGAFAEGTPFAHAQVQSYVAEKISSLDETKSDIPTVSITRTFWEKITILHYLHFLPEDRQTPLRHSRHFYDLFMLANSEYKDEIFASSSLLTGIIAFDRKYYTKRGVNYDGMNLQTLQILPTQNRIPALQKDYELMSDMILGKKPSWDAIMDFLAQLEEKLHSLEIREENDFMQSI